MSNETYPQKRLSSSLSRQIKKKKIGEKMIKLMQGDCLERIKEIPDNSVDMILTDPPYGMDFQSNHRNKKYNKIKNDKDLSWLDVWVGELFRVAADNTAHYIFCSFHNIDRFFKLFSFLVN